MEFVEAVDLTIEQLCKVAETNSERLDIVNALGEVVVNGVEYQVQISLIANKKLWIAEKEVRFIEVTKIHH